MREVRVNKGDLLEKMRANRTEHRNTFARAVERYRERMKVHLESMIDDVQHRRPVDHHIYMPVPEEHTVDYDRAIGMLEMSLDEEILLSENDFNCYVMDQWAWAGTYAANTTSYLVQ